MSSVKAHLWTKGFIPRLQTQLGLETPNSLEIEITRGDTAIETVCADILALTKLNYNSCLYGDGLPVTLRFADRIGEVLTAGRDVESGVLPFKHYV
jgi:argonaute-like protein implicated in RNA metabolism and viral defense